MPWIDPIVEEVRQARQRIWEECGCDWDRLIAFLKEREAEHPERLVTAEELKARRAAASEPFTK